MARKDEVAVYTDKNTHVTEHVSLNPHIYAVCYEGCPIEIRSSHLSHERLRQQKTMFTTKSRAVKLANRLNTRYKTDRFTVENLTVDGENKT